MNTNKKLLGGKRREYILRLLIDRDHPLTGSALAEETGVSRQVIVQDVALLKARNEPIIATPQGYMYLSQPTTQTHRQVIACRHHLAETALELNTLVDHGCKVIDVMVEHPIYGEISGSLMIQTRLDVKRFIQNVKDNKASLLASLTGGVHLHTIEATSEDHLIQACEALDQEGILLDKE